MCASGMHGHMLHLARSGMTVGFPKTTLNSLPTAILVILSDMKRLRPLPVIGDVLRMRRCDSQSR